MGYHGAAVRPSRSKRGLLFGLVGIAALAGVVFAPVATYGFAYDDHWTVEHNPALEGRLAPLLRTLLAGRAALRRIPDATRPAMVTSLWVDRRAFGADPAGYHLHSLLLYCLCSALATLAALSITRRWSSALAAGAFFAVMPVHAEVVAAINYREDLICAAAVLGVVAWLFAPRRGPELIDHAILGATLWLLGLLGKESAVSLAPIALAVAMTRPSALRWAAERRGSLASLAVALFGWGAWRAWLRLGGRDDVPLALAHRGMVERVLRTARYMVRGTLDALAPIGWSPDYAPEPTPSGWWLAALSVLIAAAVALARWPRGRTLAAGLAIALVAGLPTSPLVSPINERADRYAFLATLGGALIWGAVASHIARRAGPRLQVLLLAAALLPMAAAARRAAAPWRSDAALWESATVRAPTSARAWTGRALSLRSSGDLDASDRALARAIELDPHFLRARVNRVYNRLARGDVGRAREEIDEIRRLGGARQLGMRRARECAEQPPDAAIRCANGQ